LFIGWAVRAPQLRSVVARLLKPGSEWTILTDLIPEPDAFAPLLQGAAQVNSGADEQAGNSKVFGELRHERKDA
jgi:hypothetical protein